MFLLKKKFVDANFQADLQDAINSDCEDDYFVTDRRKAVAKSPNDQPNLATIKNQMSERFVSPKMKVTSNATEEDDYANATSPKDRMVPSQFQKGRQLNHTQDELKSINIHYEKSFLLLDGLEELRVNTAEIFAKRLGCAMDTKMKVVSIFGNTGDGKSHTMNHAFFNGDEVFRTSAAQDSCTLGVWSAFQPQLGVLCLDTEGLLACFCCWHFSYLTFLLKKNVIV